MSGEIFRKLTLIICTPKNVKNGKLEFRYLPIKQREKSSLNQSLILLIRKEDI